MTPPVEAETLQALTQSRAIRTQRLFLWSRILGTGLLITFSLWGVVAGLRQQVLGLPPESIDCPYRIQILRDRLLNSMERSRLSAGSGTAFTQLLRETRAACTSNPALQHKLEVIERIANEQETARRRAEVARDELRAL